MMGIRHLMGVLLLDWWPFIRAVRDPGNRWLTLCNRTERLQLAPDGSGAKCQWRWTSELHAARVMPSLGRRLLNRALKAAPIAFSDTFAGTMDKAPEVSVVIGHRGLTRLPLLCTTLKTLAAQRDVAFECIVVEHSEAPEIEEQLPRWVRYAYVKAAPGEPYNRSRTFNEGARLAAGGCLVFHDNDLLVSQSYLAEVARQCHEGFEVVNPKRYLFYLNEADTAKILERASAIIFNLQSSIFNTLPVPIMVLQNATGGGSLGVSRAAFEAVGGWDEGFEGWGGEDVDFWDRLQTRKVYPFGCFPLIHLWHAPQPEKKPEKDSPAMRRLEEVTRIPIEDRISKLLKKSGGSTSFPLSEGGIRE